MSVTRTWKVYGRPGHRKKESYEPSVRYDFSNEEVGTRILDFQAADKTGTHDYVLVTIERETAELCEKELYGQITDGYFEDSYVGDVIEVVEKEA